MAYYKTGQYDKAIIDLEGFAKYDNQFSTDDALWFLTLSYLKINPPQVADAQESLKKLIQDYDSKDEVAEELLEQLKAL